jgi:hydrogenase nickel incorporation protein HypA/HybF
MHEMALAASVIRIVEDAAREQGFTRVRTVRLEIGCLAGVEPDAMRFCMDAVARGTVAEAAALDIVDVWGSGWCMRCSKPVSLSTRIGECPECGSFQVQVTGGTEMRVKELEVE